MVWIFLKKDFRDNLKTWLGCLIASVVMFILMYFSSTLLNDQGNLILSQSFTMFMNLIPLIYLIVAGNGLVVKKVDDGSFYLEMVSGYKRSSVILTKIIYYVSSLFLIYVALMLSGFICYAIKPVTFLSTTDILLLCVMSFLLNLSLGSIIFCASCFFNAYRYSMLAGAGIPLVSYAFNTISGMFENIPGLEDNTMIKILVKLKYISFHSLFSYDEIIAGTSFSWIGVGVFLGVSVVFYILSYFLFTKKDLPL